MRMLHSLPVKWPRLNSFCFSVKAMLFRSLLCKSRLDTCRSPLRFVLRGEDQNGWLERQIASAVRLPISLAVGDKIDLCVLGLQHWQRRRLRKDVPDLRTRDCHNDAGPTRQQGLARDKFPMLHGVLSGIVKCCLYRKIHNPIAYPKKRSTTNTRSWVPARTYFQTVCVYCSL